MHRNLTYLFAAVLALAFTACGKYEKPKSSPTIGTFEMMCDDSFENIMEQEVDVFEYQYPDAHVLVRYAPMAQVLDSMLNGNIRTICIPRELTKEECERVKKHTGGASVRQQRIAVDAVALIVNPANPVDYLSANEVSDILAGKVKTWQDIDPNGADKPVTILFDKAGSSMIGYMRDSLLNEGDTLSTLYAQGSVAKVIETVKADKNVIGVVGVSWLTSDLRDSAPLDTLFNQLNDESTSADMGEIDNQVKASGVKVLGIRTGKNVYKPYQQNIYNGSYPFTRSIFLATTNRGGPASGFYSFVTGYIGQKLLMKTGVMPARMHIQVVELVE